MKFALTYVYDPERAAPGGMEEIQEWLDLDKEIREAGAHVYADGLQPASEARPVSLRAGQEAVIQGPETAPLVRIISDSRRRSVEGQGPPVPSAAGGSHGSRPRISERRTSGRSIWM